MSGVMREPQEGDQVLFSDVRGQASVPGTITHVWGGGCVNVALISGEIRPSVMLVQHGPRPAGYYCEFAPAPESAVEPAKFRFGLGTTSVINVSGELGRIVARAEYLNSEPSYLLQYRSNTGDAVEQWWRESALT